MINIFYKRLFFKILFFAKLCVFCGQCVKSCDVLARKFALPVFLQPKPLALYGVSAAERRRSWKGRNMEAQDKRTSGARTLGTQG